MKQVFLIPNGGAIRDPQTKAVIPATGAWMPLDTFWKRRVMFGEVRIADPPKKAEVKKIYDERKDEK